MSKELKKYLFIISLTLVALVERLFIDLGPNVELVTFACILASLYINPKWGIITALFSLALSDAVEGNTNIAIFTWSAYAVIALGSFGLKYFRKNPQKRLLGAALGGIFASLWFYLWTNFGVWVLDSFQMYPDTWQGLVQSYVMGLPFLKNQLFSNLIILPIGVSIIEIYFSIKKIYLSRIAIVKNTSDSC